MNLLPIQDFVTSLFISKILACQAYIDFPDVDYFITKYQNITLGNITTRLIRKSLVNWEAVKLMKADTDFPKF